MLPPLLPRPLMQLRQCPSLRERGWRTAIANEPPSLRNDFLADSVENNFRRTVQIQLLHDAGAMGFHGVWRKIQDGGYFFIRLPFGQQLKDFFLAVGKQVIGILETMLL